MIENAITINTTGYSEPITIRLIRAAIIARVIRNDSRYLFMIDSICNTAGTLI